MQRWAPPRLLLPPVMYVQAGGQILIDVRGITQTHSEDATWEVPNVDLVAPSQIACAQSGELWTLTVSGSASGDYHLGVSAQRRDAGEYAQPVVRVVPQITGASPARNVLVVSDSYIHGTSVIPSIMTALGAPFVPVGTFGTPPVSHEGRGGWRFACFATDYTDGWGSNPFWYDGELDIAHYLTLIDAPDIIVWMLGTNDLFGMRPWASWVEPNVTEMLAYATTLRLAWDAQLPAVKHVYAIEPRGGPNAGYAHDYSGLDGASSWWYWRKSHRQAERMMAELAGLPRTTVCATWLCMSRATCYPAEACHPNETGNGRLAVALANHLAGVW